MEFYQSVHIKKIIRPTVATAHSHVNGTVVTCFANFSQCSLDVFVWNLNDNNENKSKNVNNKTYRWWKKKPARCQGQKPSRHLAVMLTATSRGWKRAVSPLNSFPKILSWQPDPSYLKLQIIYKLIYKTKQKLTFRDIRGDTWNQVGWWNITNEMLQTMFSHHLHLNKTMMLFMLLFV